MGKRYETTIQSKTQWRDWEGWGTSLCWWAKEFGQREELAKLLFGMDDVNLRCKETDRGELLPGLGMNIVRYNLGGCSEVAIDYEGKSLRMQTSPSISPQRQIEGYWLNWFDKNSDSASWNWAADENQRAMLVHAKEHGAIYFELFSNSPMWWMCKNHNPSGNDDKNSDNLQYWNYENHARYLVTVAQRARDHWGITFNSISPFNEPVSNFWHAKWTQEGCHFDTSTQAVVIDHLRNQLDMKGMYETAITASDEFDCNQAKSTWESFSEETKQKIGKVNVHGYGYEWVRRDLLAQALDGNRVWVSEYGDGNGEEGKRVGNDSGIRLATNLNFDFRWLHPTAWCYWQPLDWSEWGLISSNLDTHWFGPANAKYFVLAHYTRHIRPGMDILDGGESNTVAAYDHITHKLVIITTNYESEQWVDYNLSQFTTVGGPITRWETNTWKGDYVCGKRYQKNETDTILQSNKRFGSSFEPYTVQTFEIYNVWV